MGRGRIHCSVKRWKKNQSDDGNVYFHDVESAYGGVVTWEVTEEQLGQRSTECSVVGITSTVLDTPRRKVRGCSNDNLATHPKKVKKTKTPTRKVRSIKPIPTHQSNRIRQNRPRHRIPTTNPTTRSKFHNILRLQTGVQLQIINMFV